MAKKSDYQELKAQLRESLVQWFASRTQYCDGQCYRVVNEDKKLVVRLKEEDCIYEILSKSRQVCEQPQLGPEFHMWDKDIRQVMQHAITVMRDRKDASIIAVGDTPLSGDYSGRPYAINRLPVDFGLPNTIQPGDWPEELDKIMEVLPEFYHDLRSRMVSPEMWDILTCFFGRVVSEDKPSEEFVYWWGEGGDGKGSLTDLFFRHMPETSAPISHDNFESRFGAGVYGEKRFVRIDEVPPGGFFTERVKEVTGGAEFINIERKGKDAVTVKSRLALMFASNYSPSFDGSMAQKRRLRVVECTQRVSQARDVKSELEASFGAFLAYCLINYRLHERKIPENHSEVLDKLADETNLRADTWIINNIRYDAGGWMSSSDLTTLFQETNKAHGKLTFERMMKRFREVAQKMSTDGGVVMPRKRNEVRGWQNVAKRELPPQPLVDTTKWKRW